MEDKEFAQHGFTGSCGEDLKTGSIQCREGEFKHTLSFDVPEEFANALKQRCEPVAIKIGKVLLIGAGASVSALCAELQAAKAVGIEAEDLFTESLDRLVMHQVLDYVELKAKANALTDECEKLYHAIEIARIVDLQASNILEPNRFRTETPKPVFSKPALPRNQWQVKASHTANRKRLLPKHF